MAADGSVVIEILGDADEITKSLKKVAEIAPKLGDGFKEAFDGLSDSALKASGEIEKSMSGTAEFLTESTKEVQAGSEGFKALGDAAQEAGTEAADAMSGAAAASAEATQAVEEYSDEVKRLAKAYEEQGMSAEEALQAAARDTETAKNKMAVLEAQYESAQKKVADLTKAFNESAKENGAASEKTQKLARELQNAENAADAAQRELEQYAKGADEAGKESQETEKQVKGLSSSFGGMAGSLTASIVKANLLTDAIKSASAALFKLGKSVFDVGAGFEESMSQVAATMGLSVEEIQNGSEAFITLQNAAKEAGATTAFSASEAASALNYLALAGYDAATSAEVLPSVLNLAAAGSMDLAYASDLATDAMAALGIEASSANLEQFGDQLAAAASNANASVSQLGEAILVVGGTAKSLAGGTTELNAALGVLANRGIKGAEGGTALRNIILSLSAPTDKAAASLEKLGVAVYDAEGNMRPLNDVFEDLSASMEGMTEGDKTNVLNDIFNKVDLKSAQALLAGTGEEFDALAEAIENSQGAMEDMAAVQLDNLNGDITILKSGLEGLGIALYETMQVNARDAVQGITGAVGAISDALSSGGLEAAIEVAGQQIAGFATAIAGQAPKIISAGTSLIQSLLKGIRDNLPALASSAVDVVTSLASGIIELLPDILETGLEILTALALGIADALPELVPVAVEAILQLVETLTDPGTLSNLVDAAIAIIMGLATGLISALPVLIEKAPIIVGNLVTALAENAPKLLEAAVVLIAQLADGLLTEFVNVAAKVGGWAYDNIVVPITEKVQDFAEAGKQLIKGLWNGINDMASWIAEKIQGFGEGVLNSLKSFFGIQSPSKLMRDEVGKYIGEGVAKGIEDSTQDAVDSAESMAEAVADTLENNVTASIERGMDFNGSKAGEAFMDAVAESVENGADTVRKATGDVADAILKSMDGLNARLEKQQQEASDRIAVKDLEDQERKIQEKYDKLRTATEEQKKQLYADIEKLESDWNAKQLKAQEAADQKLLQSQIKSLETIQKEYEKAYGDIEKSRDNLAGRLQDYGDLFTVDKVNGKEIFSVNDLQSQIDDMNAFADAFTALRDKGADKGLLDEILAMNTGDATKFAQALLAKTDADFENYLAKWEEKQNLAAQIATGIYEEDFEALNTEFLDKVPEAAGRLSGEMEPVGEEAIQALADGMAAKGEEAVAVAEGIADDIAAQLSRITDLSNQLKSAVEVESARLSAQLTVNSNAPAEAAAARARSNAAQNAAANAAMGSVYPVVDVTLTMDGDVLARKQVDPMRKAFAEKPEVLDDT